MREVILAPLASIYGAVMSARNWLYDHKLLPIYTSSLPVICIGNLTAGGNGKTPLVQLVVSLLQQQGKKPVVLTRGYGGSLRGPVIVDRENHSYREVGDEPLLHAMKLSCAVVVAKDRVLGAKFIEERKLGDTIVLDDGMQHRRLARNLDIVAVNVSTQESQSSFLRGKLLPLGRFREARDPGLSRAGLVAWLYRKPTDEKVPQKLLDILPTDLPSVQGYFSASITLSGPVTVVCAIGQPEGFLETVVSCGGVIEEQFLFSDHEEIPAALLEKLFAEGKTVVTTEKDAVRMTLKHREKVVVIAIELFLSNLSLVEHLVRK